LVLCTQVAFPIFRNIEGKTSSNSSIDHIDQLFGQEILNDSKFIISDKVDVFSLSVELGHTLFYTLSDFSLDAYHGLLVLLKWNLSSLVNINFTLADKIFPFACFW